MTLDLLKRSEAGRKLTAVEHDINFTAIENEVNALAGAGSVTGLTVVSNIAALRGIAPTAGAAVYVTGYNTAGDGGGGLFFADMSGALQEDNGIVFGIVADQSATQTKSAQSASSLQTGNTLGSGNLVFGSVQVDPNSNNTSIVFNDTQMHGHRMNSNGSTIVPLINHKTGVIASGYFSSYLNNTFYTSGVTTADVRYKFYTDARRWVRHWDKRSISAQWFGLVDGSSADQRNMLCWAFNAAKRLGAKEFRLNGAYNIFGNVEIPGGLDWGWGKIVYMPNIQLRHLHQNYDTDFPDNLAVEVFDSASSTCFLLEDGATYMGVRSLEIDGNYHNNIVALENISEYTRAGINNNTGNGQSAIQNSPVWGGVQATNHGGRVVPNGAVIYLENVHIHGVASNNLLGHSAARFYGVNVTLGNSARNHLFYSAQGEFHNLKIYGFAWEVYIKVEHAKIYGLEVINPTSYQNGSNGGFTPSWTVSNVNQIISVEGQSWGASVDSSHRRRRIGFALRDAHINLAVEDSDQNTNNPVSDANLSWKSVLMNSTSQHIIIDGLVVLGPTVGSGEVRIAHSLSNVNAIQEQWTFRNITLFNRGGQSLNFAGNSGDLRANVLLDGFTLTEQRGYEAAPVGDGNLSAWGRLSMPIRGSGLTLQVPRHYTFRRCTDTIGHQELIDSIDISSDDPVPVHIAVEDCSLVFNGSILANSSGGLISAFTNPNGVANLTAMWRNTTVHRNLSSNFQNLELLYAISAFFNCRDMSGRVSEQTGIVSITTNPQTVDIPTKLMWHPGRVILLSRSGALRVDSWEVRTTNGATNLTTTPTSTNVDRRSPMIRVTVSGGTGTLYWAADMGIPLGQIT